MVGGRRRVPGARKKRGGRDNLLLVPPHNLEPLLELEFLADALHLEGVLVLERLNLLLEKPVLLPVVLLLLDELQVLGLDLPPEVLALEVELLALDLPVLLVQLLLLTVLHPLIRQGLLLELEPLPQLIQHLLVVLVVFLVLVLEHDSLLREHAILPHQVLGPDFQLAQELLHLLVRLLQDATSFQSLLPLSSELAGLVHPGGLGCPELL